MYGEMPQQTMVGGAILSPNGQPNWSDAVSNDVNYGWIINPTGQLVSREGFRFCTGFLVGQQTFLTAGHCLGNVCQAYEETGNFQVSFNYHTGEQERGYQVKEMLEHGTCQGVDYGVFKLASNAAYQRFGLLPLQSSVKDRRETRLVITQHPGGATKKIAFGSLTGYSDFGFFSHNVDTLPGSSGSPVAKINSQAAVGVHVSAGNGEENLAVPIESIAEVSERIANRLT